MNKNINTVVELTEKELACVCGGFTREQLELGKMALEAEGYSKEFIRRWLEKHLPTD